MLESIMKQVEVKREKMIESALEKGVLDKGTIRLSKELDELLNEYRNEKSRMINIEE